MVQRVIKLNSEIKVMVEKKEDFAKVEDTIFNLIASKQLKDGDVIYFGKYIRVNHKTCAIKHNKLIPIVIDNPNSRDKKRSIKRLSYVIEGDKAIFKTNQKNPVEFTVDVDDIDKVLEHNWECHPYYNGEKYIVYRYRDEHRKWKVLPLSRHLGFGKGYAHINGNRLDLRKENMVMKAFIGKIVSEQYKKKEQKEKLDLD